MRAIAAALSIAVCLGRTAAAQTKPAWEWTSQERAQARRDPAKRLERLRADDAERRAARTPAKPAPADVIDGNRNPELYFVTELFEYMVRSAFVTLPEAFPHVIRQHASGLFTDDAEWKRFAAIVADYAEVLRQEHNAANALDKNAVAAVKSRKCAAEARTLREARRAFGKTRFDRMLYETVPAGMQTSFSIDDTNFEMSIGSALARDERCQ